MRNLVDWFINGPFGTLGFVDVLDIGILAFAIYMVLRVLQGTRGFQSLMGLLVLGGVYVLAYAIGLSTLRWVLDNLLVYAVLGLLILFQDDIRRVLAQAGRRMLVGRGSIEAADIHMIEEIVKVAFVLAHKRIGALIAIERTASLATLAESGEVIDAVTSTELLQSIFHPSSPLHDGAVVIQRSRIAKAGVFLPLSQNRDLPKVYGTRHRAAVGLSELSDSVCVLVSEERGTVAFAVEGEMTAVSDANELREQLQALLRQDEEPTKTSEVKEESHE